MFEDDPQDRWVKETLAWWNEYVLFCFPYYFSFTFLMSRQIPGLPHPTAGAATKRRPKKNKSGIEDRIMDPIARRAAQRAAKLAAAQASPSAPPSRANSIDLDVSGLQDADQPSQPTLAQVVNNIPAVRSKSPPPSTQQPALPQAASASGGQKVLYFSFSFC